jgi:hypothetical protein
MTVEQKKSIPYCGLLCILYCSDCSCDCHSMNECGKKSYDEGCFQNDYEVRCNML